MSSETAWLSYRVGSTSCTKVQHSPLGNVCILFCLRHTAKLSISHHVQALEPQSLNQFSIASGCGSKFRVRKVLRTPLSKILDPPLPNSMLHLAIAETYLYIRQMLQNKVYQWIKSHFCLMEDYFGFKGHKGDRNEAKGCY